MTIQARAKKALKATQKVKESGADWLEANNALFGVGGEFSKLFPTVADRTAFIKTAEATQVMELLEGLPQPKSLPPGAKPLEEVNGQIHVRVPRTVHASLLAEAQHEDISLNQLILSKLCMQLRAMV